MSRARLKTAPFFNHFKQGEFSMNIRGYKQKEITCSDAVAKICSAILKAECITDQNKEHFWSIGLNSANRIKYVELVTLGLLNQTIVHARELFRMAIMESVASIIVCHNHPSGEVKASIEDKKKTTELIQAGKIIGIQLLDHVIIGGKDTYFSFSDEGIL